MCLIRKTQNRRSPLLIISLVLSPQSGGLFCGCISMCMTDKKSDQPNKRVYTKKAPSRGGARAGSGRPKGSTTKVRLEDLMTNIEAATGKSYGEILALNYASAIQRADWNGVRDYDKAFMNKMLADKTEVTNIDSEDAVAVKQAAFAEAIRQIAGISPGS